MNKSNIKRVVITVLVTFFVVFILQNLEHVSVPILIWDVGMPRALLIGVIFLIGIAVGLLLNKKPRSIFK